jgi:hypothetical protein
MRITQRYSHELAGKAFEPKAIPTIASTFVAAPTAILVGENPSFDFAVKDRYEAI